MNETSSSTGKLSAGKQSHGALVYSDRNDFISAAAQFFGCASAEEAELLIIATDENLTAFAPLLQAYGRARRLAEVSNRGADPGRILGLIRMFVQDCGDRPVRCWLDVGWPGRPADELAEAIKYEALFDEAFAGSPVAVLCSYDLQIGGDLIADVRRVHSADAVLLGPEAPLGRPPVQAVTLTFREDQARVRHFAAAWARDAGLPAVRIGDLMIAVGELTGNTLVHTSDQGTFAIWLAAGEIVFQVSDTGWIKDPLAGTLRPAPTSAGSRRGLWLVHQLGDLVQTRTGPTGTTVRVHMRLPG